MTDVFISYAREQRSTVLMVEQFLAAHRISCWYDAMILPHEDYDMSIKKSLVASKSVLVLWSTAAADSSYVRGEASFGLRGEKLINAKVHECEIPFEFTRINTVNLYNSGGEIESDALLRIIASIDNLCGRRIEPRSPPSWHIDSYELHWTSAQVILSDGISKFHVEYINHLQYEAAYLNGLEAARGGNWDTSSNQLEFTIPTSNGKFQSRIEPIYSLIGRLVTIKLKGIKIQIDGNLIATLMK